MALNSNHTVEDLNEVKCAIVEKNVSAMRASFLKEILEYNKYIVIVVPSAPAKSAKTPPTEASEATETPVSLEAPTSFTVGVTDVRFNSINAVFGRLLKSADDHVVTLSYWNQKDTVSHDEVPYYEQA